jgi:O-antigen/teichoic acid export membrane protein
MRGSRPPVTAFERDMSKSSKKSGNVIGRMLFSAFLPGRFVAGATARTVVGNSGWRVATYLPKIVSTLIVGTWVARYLGPSRFGSLNFAIAFVALYTFLCEVASQQIVVRELVWRPQDRPGIVASAVTLRLIGACLAIVLAIGSICLFRSQDRGAQLLVLVIALSLVPQAWDVIDFDYQARLDSRPIAFIRTASMIVFSAFKVGMILLGAGVVWFAWAVVGEAALSAYVMRRRLGRILPEFRLYRAALPEMKRLLHTSWPLALSGLTVAVYMRIDQVMLGEMLGNHAVGIFSAAVRLSESWYFVPAALVAGAAPALTAVHRRSRKEFNRALLLVMRPICWLSILAAVALSFGSGPVVRLLFGVKYAESATILMIHSWAGIFSALGLCSGPWFVNDNIQKLGMVNTICGAATNILVNLILIPRYGPIGAAVATLISQFVAAMGMNVISKKTRPLLVLQLKALTTGYVEAA